MGIPYLFTNAFGDPFWGSPEFLENKTVRTYRICNPVETDLNLASKMYGFVRPTLEMGWGAALRGFFSKEEPFKEG